MWWCDDCNWSDLHAKLDTIDAQRHTERDGMSRQETLKGSNSRTMENGRNYFQIQCEQMRVRTGTETTTYISAVVTRVTLNDNTDCVCGKLELHFNLIVENVLPVCRHPSNVHVFSVHHMQNASLRCGVQHNAYRIRSAGNSEPLNCFET